MPEGHMEVYMLDDLTLYSAEARMKYDDAIGQADTYRRILAASKTARRRRFSLRNWLLRRSFGLKNETSGRALHGTEMGCGYRV